MKPFKIIKDKKKKFIVFNKNISIGLIGSDKNKSLKKIITSKNFECEIFNKIKDKNIKTFFKKIDILISYDNRHIFSEKNIKNFKYQILNIHGAPLPNFAGRGVYSNMILLNSSLIGSTLHVVTNRIDLGEILMFSQKVKLNNSSLPISYIKNVEKLSLSLLIKFLDLIKKDKKFELYPQNENLRFFSKKYISSIDGEIDWNWKGSEIVKFIKAFSNPYDYAFTYLKNKKNKKNKKIFIKNGKFKKTLSHPFLIGKIFQYNSQNKSIKVFTNDGFLTIKSKDLVINNKKTSLSSLEGNYFIKE